MAELADYVSCRRCGRPYPERIFTNSRMASFMHPLPICPACADLEAWRGFAGWPPIPPHEWPVDPDELGREYALLIRCTRRGELQEMRVEELEDE
ncbi:MAG TPA: hypothetical protein VFR49_05945 [Solirubrobacteraceae bacterium]|nr:hypothetical protein [Solirubrobacteraceae bacterium]